MTYHGRAVETPAIVAQLADILRTQWDPEGILRDAAGGAVAFYDEQALIVAGMLSAAGRDLDVQRYLRQVEQRLVVTTIHPVDARHAIAVMLWQTVRADEAPSRV